MSVCVRRARLVVPAVLGLVGSLLAVSAGPSAAAGDGKPSNPAAYSACVAAATTDAGFTDMDGGHAKAAANCLAHYGITTGTAPGVYSPSAQVTRAQMAVFLARAAGPSGLDLGATTDQGFADIGGYSMMFQDAINRVAKAGIMSGTSMSMFSPAMAVSRADMAVFLDAFVGKARIGPGGLGGAAKYADVKPDDDPFTDIGGVPVGTYGSIRKVYELGIASGTGMGMFSPDASVTRNQMALFITRALAHTNARPAGLSLQADKTKAYKFTSFMLHAAHRGRDHMPMVNTALDFFSAGSASAAFDQNGLCKTLKTGVIDPAAVSSRCVIDSGDESTDGDGNVVAEVAGTGAYCAGGKRVWAWTGATNSRFDVDTTTSAFVDIGVSEHWRSINVSSTLKKHATHVRFGQSITYTLQLVDEGGGKGDAVAWKDVAITTKIVETAAPGSNTREVTQTHKTDASGKVELTFSYDDPNPQTTGQMVTVALTGTTDAFLGAAPAPTTGGGSPPPGGGGGPPAPPGRGQAAPTKALGTVIWTDAAAAANRLLLSAGPFPWQKASAEGNGARNTVEAQLLDQYGDPVSGVDVHFWSSANNHNSSTADNGLGGKSDTLNGGTGGVKGPSGQTHLGTVDNFAVTVRTNSRGIARTSYFRDSAVSRLEVIGAVAQIGLRDGAAGTPASDPSDVYFMDQDPGTPTWDMLAYRWAKEATSATTMTNLPSISTINKVANEFILANTNTGEIWLVRYDSNDHYNYSAGGSTVGVSMATFEDHVLQENRSYTVVLAVDPIPGVNTFTRTSRPSIPSALCHD